MFGFGVKTITTEQLAEKIAAGKPVLIDVREPREVATGRIEGSVNIPLGMLPSKIGTLDPHAETLLICHSGNRSATAARLLTRAGFERAYSVTGGMAAWRGTIVR